MRVLNPLLCLCWYSLLAGDVSWTEFAAGLPVSVAVMIYIDVQCGNPGPRFQMRLPWRSVKSALTSLVVDSGRVGAELASSLVRPTGGGDLASAVSRRRRDGGRCRTPRRRYAVRLARSQRLRSGLIARRRLRRSAYAPTRPPAAGFRYGVACLSAWTLACIAMLPALAVPVFAGLRGSVAYRIAGLQLTASVATLLLALLTFALDEPSFMDLSLCLALLSMPGTLLLAHFLERWL